MNLFPKEANENIRSDENGTEKKVYFETDEQELAAETGILDA